MEALTLVSQRILWIDGEQFQGGLEGELTRDYSVCGEVENHVTGWDVEGQRLSSEDARNSDPDGGRTRQLFNGRSGEHSRLLAGHSCDLLG